MCYNFAVFSVSIITVVLPVGTQRASFLGGSVCFCNFDVGQSLNSTEFCDAAIPLQAVCP
jgi:hypothetical protein